jgi:hypothetical protein
MYDFRHTIATRWVEGGIDLPTVAAWLGHSSSVCIMKYVHIQPQHRSKQKRGMKRKCGQQREKGTGRPPFVRVLGLKEAFQEDEDC